MPSFRIFLYLRPLSAPILVPFHLNFMFFTSLFRCYFTHSYQDRFSSIFKPLQPRKLCFYYGKSIVSANALFLQKLDFGMTRSYLSASFFIHFCITSPNFFGIDFCIGSLMHVFRHLVENGSRNGSRHATFCGTGRCFEWLGSPIHPGHSLRTYFGLRGTNSNPCWSPFWFILYPFCIHLLPFCHPLLPFNRACFSGRKKRGHKGRIRRGRKGHIGHKHKGRRRRGYEGHKKASATAT